MVWIRYLVGTAFAVCVVGAVLAVVATKGRGLPDDIAANTLSEAATVASAPPEGTAINAAPGLAAPD